MIERALSNSISDEKIKTGLNIYLGKNHLSRYNFPLDSKITREEMGEHDLRLNEWIDFLNKAGFKVKIFKSFNYKNPILNKIFRSFYKLSGLGDLIFRRQLTFFPLYDYYSVGRKAGNTIFICKKP